MNPELKIALESCREAWKSNPRATHAWCCHHEVFFEELIEPAEIRIKYILENKPKDEQVVRLNNFRPIMDMKGFLPEWKKYKKIRQSAWNEYKKIEQPAYDEYIKIQQPAWNEYKKIRQPAWDEYERIDQPAYDKYIKIQQPAWNEYERIRQSALEKLCEKVAEQYQREVPLGTWNGKSIFKNGNIA